MAIGYGNHEPLPAETPKPAQPAAGEGSPKGKPDGTPEGPGPLDIGGSTPGAGTLPTNPQGDEVDPGAG